MRARFEIQLEKLNQGVTEMGALVEEALEHAIDALVHENREIAEKNIEFDREIDQKMKK
jgi:phosphate transport system protein